MNHRGLSTPARRLRLGGFAAVALLAVLVACGAPVTPDPPVRVDVFDVVAVQPIAGAYLALERPSGTSVTTVTPLQNGVVARVVNRGDRSYVAWVGSSASAGVQVRVSVERAQVSADPPTLVAASSFVAHDGADLGAAPLRWLTASDGAPPANAGTFDAITVSSDVALEASFAERPLGDVRQSGTVDVRDAMRLRFLLEFGGWSDAQRYHADLDGDGWIDASDLDALLDKVVDPALPARLVVRPTSLSFAQLAGEAGQNALVLVGNAGREPLDVSTVAPAGATVSVAASGSDGARALQVALPPAGRVGWQPGFLRLQGGDAGEAEVRLGHLVILVAGQSNAVGWGLPLTGCPVVPSPTVRMLGNDYRWKDATEPLDDPTGQLDPVSADSLANVACSFGTRLGTLLFEASGFVTYLIPSARGGTNVTPVEDVDRRWLPGANLVDRGTLFGSSLFRARVSAGLAANPVSAQPLLSEGGPVNVVVWYQGESDATDTARRSQFVDGTQTVMSTYRDQLGVPTVYVQLASNERAAETLGQHWIAERQRRLETDSGSTSPAPLSDHYMVVAFDLPRGDWIHLNAYGQRLLAERIDLAIREHVLGEDVDGTGPRLTGISWNGGTQITLRTTRVLEAGPLDTTYVTVFNGPPNGTSNANDPATGSNTLGVVSVERDPADATSVRITLASAPTATPHVVYRAPAGFVGSEGMDVKRDVIRADAGIGVADLGLPLPLFGPLTPF